MNDKRCPYCDLLVNEDAPACPCGFQFFDDTPGQVITGKRLAVTACLLLLCTACGAWAGASPLAANRELTLALLSAAAVGLSFIPSLRKQGSVGLSLAMVALIWTSFSISQARWQVVQPKTSPLVSREVYNRDQSLSMAGLQLGDVAPKKLPDGVEVGVTDEGKLFFIKGAPLMQGQTTLLKPGDTAKRIKEKFPHRILKDSVLPLGDKQFLFLEIEDESIQSVALIAGDGKSRGRGPLVNGTRMDMDKNLARFLARDLQPPNRLFVGERSVVAILGDRLQTFEGVKVEKGLPVADVEKLQIGYIGNSQPSVIYDQQDRVRQIAVGEFPEPILGPTMLPTEAASKLEAKLILQMCLRTDEKNRPTVLEEKWAVPGAVFGVAGPYEEVPADLRSAPEPHHYWREPSKKTPWSVGERSTWALRSTEGDPYQAYFLHRGEFFHIFVGPNPKVALPKNFLETVGRAVVAGRERR